MNNAASIRVLALIAALALAPPPSEAIAPVLLLFIKQIAQQAATSMIKDTMLSALSGMGCKGIALANALQGFDLRRAAGASPALGGMPRMPAGMAIPPEMMAQMRAMMPNANQLPPGLDADQAALMAQVLGSMGQPLSPAETLATIDELFDLGFMPRAAQSEFKQCMLLLPETIPALGMGMGMLKPMIPQLQQARREMNALSPAEQDEVAVALAQEIRPLPAEQRAAALEYFESGFFPARIARGVKAGLGAR